jgi:hypothetical protein
VLLLIELDGLGLGGVLLKGTADDCDDVGVTPGQMAVMYDPTAVASAGSPASAKQTLHAEALAEKIAQRHKGSVHEAARILEHGPVHEQKPRGVDISLAAQAPTDVAKQALHAETLGNKIEQMHVISEQAVTWVNIFEQGAVHGIELSAQSV